MSSHGRWLLVVAVFAVAGLLSIALSRAAASTLATEAEAGVVNGQASKLAVATASGGQYVRFGNGAGGGTQFGTLMTGGEHAAEESAAGVKKAMLEVFWIDYEPQEGQFDTQYINEMKATFNELRAAGMEVTLAMGLEAPPAWVHGYPNSFYVDQNGETNEGLDDSSLNLVFNDKMRQKAKAYYDRINQDFGIANFSDIRLTSGANIELMYPDGGYWAFDVNAQNGPDMPSTMPRNPFPGWKPGDTSITTAQVGQWADWYVKALADMTDWQMRTFRSYGFNGLFQLLTPGSGVRPSDYSADIAAYLPEDSLITVGAVWHKLYEFIPNKQGAIVYISSVADDSGDNDSCTAADRSVALNDTAADNWSATRWQARIAAEYGMPVGGENPGYAMEGEDPALVEFYEDTSENGMMAAAFRQAKGCGFKVFYWAHDMQLWDGTLEFSQYANRIAQYRQP